MTPCSLLGLRQQRRGALPLCWHVSRCRRRHRRGALRSQHDLHCPAPRARLTACATRLRCVCCAALSGGDLPSPEGAGWRPRCGQRPSPQQQQSGWSCAASWPQVMMVHWWPHRYCWTAGASPADRQPGLQCVCVCVCVGGGAYIAASTCLCCCASRASSSSSGNNNSSSSSAGSGGGDCDGGATHSASLQPPWPHQSRPSVPSRRR